MLCGNPEIKHTQTEPQHSGGLSGSGAVLVQPRQCHRCQSDADQYGIMAVRGQCARVLRFVFVDKIGKLHHINRKHRKQNHNHGQCADFKLRCMEIRDYVDHGFAEKIITSPFRRSSRCGKFTAGCLWLTKAGKIQPKPKPPSATHCPILAGNNSEPSTVVAVNPRNPATSLILRRCSGEA